MTFDEWEQSYREKRRLSNPSPKGTSGHWKHERETWKYVQKKREQMLGVPYPRTGGGYDSNDDFPGRD